MELCIWALDPTIWRLCSPGFRSIAVEMLAFQYYGGQSESFRAPQNVTKHRNTQQSIGVPDDNGCKTGLGTLRLALV